MIERNSHNIGIYKIIRLTAFYLSIIIQEHCDAFGAMEECSKLHLEELKCRNEWYAVDRTIVRRWILSGPVWKREIKFKKQWCDINIETYIVDRTQKRIYPPQI